MAIILLGILGIGIISAMVAFFIWIFPSILIVFLILSPIIVPMWLYQEATSPEKPEISLEMDISQAKTKVWTAGCTTGACAVQVAREACHFDECVKPAVIDACRAKLGTEEGLNCYALVGVVYQSKPASQWFNR